MTYCATTTEAAPPLSSALWAVHTSSKPFTSYEALIDHSEAVINGLSDGERLEVINAHPRIGVKPSDAEISAFSRLEQGLEAESKSKAGANSTKLAELEATYAELKQLNEQYETRHGFKFVEFVNGRPKSAIVPVMRARLPNASATELATGLKHMMLIAHDRLKKINAQAQAQAAAAAKSNL